jgi:hypothetical protein
MPPEKQEPGAKSRYIDFSVRTIGSTRPYINGERPDDRDPLSPLNRSQPLDYINDLQVSTRNWNPYQIIEIAEHVPLRLEVLGIYGKLESNPL